MNNKGKIAIFQISVLVMGIVAFACLMSIPLGSAVPTWVTNVGEWFTQQSGVGSQTSGLTSGQAAWNTFGVAAAWAVVWYYGAYLLGELFGFDEAVTEGIAWSAAIGGFIGGGISAGTGVTAGPAAWVGLAIAVVVYYSFFQSSYKVAKFSCNAWDAPSGGDNCEECNQQILPCSEYQCRSLGRACQLINQGTDNELCVHVGINDANPPVIAAWEDALREDFRYTPDNTLGPQDRGVFVVYEQSSDDCIPAFTPLRFGVTLNEPAKCKIDTLRKPSFEEMDLFLSEGDNAYNHTVQFSLPGTDNAAIEGLTIQNDGDYELYVRCEDVNGNPNPANFVFKYCVDKGPDNRAPEVRSASILNNMPIAVGNDSLDVTFYMNEPSECSWSHQDQSYDDMSETMSCATSLNDFEQYNSEVVYPCSTTLNGIQDKQDNIFYIRCKDKPSASEDSDRNVNSQSYVYTVIGTRELILDEVGPNETTIKDASESVKVTLTAKTSAGFKEGEANCYYSEKGKNNYVRFFDTGSYTHSTDLYVDEGDYEFDIKCVDLGGNADTATIEFEAESDSESPMVVRAYKSDNSLRIVTDEAAECVYDTTSCNYLFEDGLHMITSEEINHFVDWSTKTKFYIKCRDEYGNDPSSNDCSSIIKPID